jgi:HK97 family phage portal protein
MGRLADWLLGRDIESRTLTRGTETGGVPWPMDYSWPTVDASWTALPEVRPAQALKCCDIFACVRKLSEGVATMPPRVYRRQADGSSVPAGSEQRLVGLLRQPEPGSTSADLLGRVMVDVLVHGNAYVAKYRDSSGEISQLACLDPETVTVERDGEEVVYRISRREGLSDHGPEDICHVKALTSDGLYGLSTVRAAGKALGLNEGLIRYASNFLANAARPAGILASPSGAFGDDEADVTKASWQEGFSGQAGGAGKVAILSGDVHFERVEPAMSDSEFTQQRELAARECARAFGLPPWSIGASSGDSLTYSNTAMQNRSLVDHSLRPWAVRIERAVSNDRDLCPGSVYMALDFTALLRGDIQQRGEYYERALRNGWLPANEVRELEDRAPLEGDE